MRKRLLLVYIFLFIWNNSILSQPVEQILHRNDKYFLGGGKMVIWAPEYPQFLKNTGFWDHACFLNYKVEPIFTVTFLDENLQEIPLQVDQIEWVPSHLTLSYQPSTSLEIIEKRALLPGDVLTANFLIRNKAVKEKTLHIIVWTCQNIQNNADQQFPEESKNANFIYHLFRSRSRISWERWYTNASGRLDMKIGMALGAQKIAKTAAVNVSDSTWNYPYWKLTPFYEKITRNGLPDENNYEWRTNPDHFNGLLYIALHYRITIPAWKSTEFSAYCAIAPTEQEAIEAFDATPRQVNPLLISEQNWNSYFEEVPTFKCSDPYLEKIYYYRWFGLKLNSIRTDGQFNLPYPCVFEGINEGWSRHQISYSAPTHILETRWMHEPELATGSFLNFVNNQYSNGAYPGELMMGFEQQHRGFYHARWGKAVRELHRIHPNRNFLRQAYNSLVKYARYFDRERDREQMHLYDVQNQWETGQEYMSRYLFVDPEADKGGKIQLKGVDASVYMYELQKNLAWMAKELEKREEANRWEAKAKQTGEAILSKMWDDQLHFFVDVDPKTGDQSPYKTSVGFYPFLTDLVGKKHLPAITEHLLNPNEFWTDFPVPATSLDGSDVSIFGDWKDKRRSTPWNGRSWLMATSHVCEALARTAQRLDEKLKPAAVELINRFIRMLFLTGDLNRPSSYEYYNPFNGIPPYFRGTDDYMHSWVNDLIIKYVVGLQPADGNKIIIDPLPFNLDWFTFDNVQIKGHLLKILWRKQSNDAMEQGLYIFVDGKLAKHLKALRRYEFHL